MEKGVSFELVPAEVIAKTAEPRSFLSLRRRNLVLSGPFRPLPTRRFSALPAGGAVHSTLCYAGAGRRRPTFNWAPSTAPATAHYLASSLPPRFGRTPLATPRDAFICRCVAPPSVSAAVICRVASLTPTTILTTRPRHSPPPQCPPRGASHPSQS
ncbi:hypothetical protein K438DRAFT_1968795 [Mycena galopus ATCC 62051]|nr:hypothetical protein K438DRAFT_1968795 [Mycena galopus ATCC 62051]